MLKNWIKNLTKMFEPLTLEERIRQKREKAVLDKYYAERTIHHHRFLVHMAQAKIAALDAWVNKKNG